jgi:hypothetical protein
VNVLTLVPHDIDDLGLDGVDEVIGDVFPILEAAALWVGRLAVELDHDIESNLDVTVIAVARNNDENVTWDVAESGPSRVFHVDVEAVVLRFRRLHDD